MRPAFRIFPYRGKPAEKFSIPWKIRPEFFHTVENPRKSFPCRRKLALLFAALGWLLLVGSAPASPFVVTAARAEFEGRPAIRVAFDFPADHHLYSGFTVATPAGEALAALSVPEPDTHNPDEPEPSYAKPFAAFYAPPAGNTVVVEYIGCKGSMCFMPPPVAIRLDEVSAEATAAAPAASAPAAADAAEFPLAARGPPRRSEGYLAVPDFLAFLDPAAAPPPAASAWRLFLDDPAQFYRRRGVLPSILLILVGGFLLNLTPCVLPMIPVNLAIIGATSLTASRRARFGLGLVYGLGMALVYGALGLAVVLTGSVFGALHASPLFNGAIALLFFVLALAMFDVWQLDFTRFRKTSGRPSRARIPAVLAMGGVSALLAGACVAPVLIAVLALSGSLYAQGVALALALPFLLGVGMALPWPLAAAGLAVLPKPGAWMDGVKKAFGVLILLLAAFYAWKTIGAFRASASAETPPPNFVRVDFNEDGAAAAFQARLAEAAASGKPVLFDFGAHWCTACTKMDATTLRDSAVVAKTAGLYAIQVLADQPNKSPARELLAPFAVPGYPTFLIFPASPIESIDSTDSIRSIPSKNKL